MEQQKELQPQQSGVKCNLRSSMLTCLNELTYYNLACVLYYLYPENLALISEKKDIWIHNINTDNTWEVVDCSFVVRLIETTMISEFKKLSQEYKAISTEDNCPYDLYSKKIVELMENLALYTIDIIHEAKPFYKLQNPKTFFEQFMNQTNLSDIMNTILDLYINNDNIN